MSSFKMKLIICPIILVLAPFLNLVDYPSIYFPITLGLILAVLSRLMDAMLLKPGTLWISLVSTFLIYGSQMLSLILQSPFQEQSLLQQFYPS